MIEVFSPAKINLNLHVKGLRADGYHEIETILATIGLFDVLTIQPSASLQVEVLGLDIQCNEKDNLAYKAAILFFKTAQVPMAEQNFRIQIKKKIPAGAGLAGGSSNAIATLIGLNHVFKNRLPFETLLKLARELGSDTAFFLYGSQCLCTGRGEIITPIESKFTDKTLYLFLPNLHIATKHVFTEWHKAKDSQPNKLLQNDLEKAVWNLHPIMQEKFEKLKNLYQDKCMMSGSGSTYFVIGDAQDETPLQKYATSIECQMIKTSFVETPCYVN